MRFDKILRGRQAGPLDACIDDAIDTNLAPMHVLCPFAPPEQRCGQKCHRNAVEQRPS